MQPRNDADDTDGAEPAPHLPGDGRGRGGWPGTTGGVGLRMVPEAAVADAAGNALANTVPDGSREDYLLDNTGPTVTITAPATHDGSTAFDVTVAAGESGVVGFEAGDVEVDGGSEGDSFSGDGETFQGTVTPAGSGHVTVSVPAGAFTDALGNGNVEAERVVAHAATLFVASPQARAFTVGATFDAVALPAASGGDGTYTYALSGPDGGRALPAGLRFDATARTLSGTPEATTAGAVALEYTVTDGGGATYPVTFDVTVNPAPVLAAVADRSYALGVSIPPLALAAAQGGTAPLGYTLAGPWRGGAAGGAALRCDHPGAVGHAGGGGHDGADLRGRGRQRGGRHGAVHGRGGRRHDSAGGWCRWSVMTG